MSWIALILGLLATGISFVRWARVAQREHYLGNGLVRIARIWIIARPINLLILVLAIAAAIASIATNSRTASYAAASVAASASIMFPFWLSLRGPDQPLRWTRRLKTLAGVILVLMLIEAAILAWLASWWVAPAVVAATLLVPFELGLRLVVPIEERIALGYQRRAEKRLRHVAPTVIAVTGSWGKTTTKNHIRDLASGTLNVAMSPASFNNRAGLSRTMNEHLPEGTDLLVVEMGMYGPGEIRKLCSWVKPQIAVITAIGPMHLERVGSIEGIVHAKSEILDGADVAVLWVDDPRLDDLSRRLGEQRVIRCGLYGRSDLDVSVETQSDGLVVRIGDERVGPPAPLVGLHPANVGCAVGALFAIDLSPSRVGTQLGKLSAPAHRASAAVSDHGVVVIDDTYNSNPVGAVAALQRLCADVDGRKIVVTPGMMELGDIQFAENEAYAFEVVRAGAEIAIVGRTNRKSLATGARRAGLTPMQFSRRSEAVAWVTSHLSRGDGVLWENDLPDHYP
jgi:UDP-N-acetylmuramoyl-tripeptide--D-alanyl-D-alanine ligase